MRKCKRVCSCQGSGDVQEHAPDGSDGSTIEEPDYSLNGQWKAALLHRAWSSRWEQCSGEMPPFPIGSDVSPDDPVLALVKLVKEAFSVACACYYAQFLDPDRRKLWIIEPRSVVQLSKIVRGFTDRRHGGHLERLIGFLSAVRQLDAPPQDFGPESSVRLAYENYSLDAQFILVFRIPVAKSRQKHTQARRQSITLLVNSPPLGNYWDPTMHPYLDSASRTNVENVIKACRNLPLEMYTQNPLASMPTELVHRVFGHLVRSAPRIGRCSLTQWREDMDDSSSEEEEESE